jgi:hypothetical protein
MSNGEMNPDTIRVLAEQHGLKRGLRPVDAMPAGNSPITNPAPVFNPEQYERGK